MDRHELQMQQLLSFFDFPTKSGALRQHRFKEGSQHNVS